jgi:hypothetical protein
MATLSRVVSFKALAFSMLTNPVHALIISGKVQEVGGQPISGAMITLEARGLDANRITTYSGVDGRFAFPDIRISKIPAKAVSMQKIGYMQNGIPELKLQGKRQIFSIQARRIDNVAAQVPPSAWLAGLPDTPDGHLVTRCADCHQFPFAKARDYIHKFSHLQDAEREKVWHDVMKFMRVKGMSIAPGDTVDVSKMPLATFEDDRIS